MSEKILEQILAEIQEVKTEQSSAINNLQSLNKRMDNMEQEIKFGFKAINESLETQHVENINADTLLLNEVRSLRESVVFVNRKIADTELEVNILKHNKQ